MVSLFGQFVARGYRKRGNSTDTGISSLRMRADGLSAIATTQALVASIVHEISRRTTAQRGPMQLSSERPVGP